MDEKELENLQAEEQFAIKNPEAYLVSDPTPRDWNLTAREIAKSIKMNPYEQLTTKFQREGPEKLNWLETVSKGIWEGIKTGVQDLDETFMVQNASYSSPNMTNDEAERLMQDVLFTRHRMRESRQAETAEQIKYKKWYDFSNGVGSAIKYAGVGFLTQSPLAIGAIAGAEATAQMEADLVDRYVEKYGTIEGYDKEKRAKDLTLSTAYGIFNGMTESMLGVERIAAGALGRYSTIEALSRLARSKGQLYKSGALKALRRLGLTAAEEGSEEFIQSLGEDLTVAMAGYADSLTMDESFKKAFTSAIYGALIGGPMGWGFYRYNRKSIVDKINNWNKENNVGLNESQIVEMADQMLDDGKTKMLDEVATRVEIRNHYGKAYDLVKKRLMDQINATETVPWQDKAKTKEEYVETLADALTFPAINVANQLQIPLSDFLEIADVESWVVGNIVGFKPIRSVGDIDEIIAKQDAIIKDQREKKKLGIGNEQVLSDAQRRKTIAQRVRREVAQDQEIAKRRATSKKQTADYITARDVQPASVEALAGATTAQPGQDFVLVAGKKIPVEYQVVELSTIQPSHINGTPNPNYTNEQLQNRASRGTQQDVADLRGKALPENFTPERITRANTAAEGAPLVNAAGEVIAGNGRAEIVRYAYENPESAEKYKASLIEQGFNIEGMEQPILVRRNTTLTPDEQIAAADISNISETSAFDEASQARRDTQYLKDSATPTEFAAKLPMSDRRGLMQNNGRWNKRRVQQRYESALLSWLCGNDTQLFENLVLDRGISQKVIDVLTANGNLIYETATKYPELELREDIYNALVKMQYTTKNNFLEITQQLSLDGHDVMPENILVWNWLYADGTTNRQFMKYYATTLANNQERVNAGEDMFGQKVAPLSKKDALIQALKKSDQAKAETSASNGRNYEPLFDDNGQTQNPELLAAIISYKNQFAPVQNIAGPQEYSDSEILGIFAKALNNETIKLENWEYVRWSSLLGEGKKKRKTGIVYEPATDKQKASFARKMLDKYMPEWNQPTTSELLNKIEQFDLADENARLDDIYPAYDGETIVVDGVERTVYNSEGKRINKSAEALTNFWRWFGDSKVVDKQGRPLVVYHGSKKYGIKRFKLKKADPENIFPEDLGTQRSIAFFTNDKRIADLFAWQGQIYPVYLKIQNPETFDEEGKEWDEFREWKWIKDAGLEKDGIIVKNLIEAPAVNDIVADDYIVFNNKQIKSVENRGTYSSDTGNIYYQKRGRVLGQYDPELQTIMLGKYWNELTLVHEFHHRYLELMWGYFKQAQLGQRTMPQDFINDLEKLFGMLEIDPNQESLTTVQQEKFTYMVEAYLTGLGVENTENLAFQGFLHWIPEKYKSIMDLGYLDENNIIQNPMLDEESIAWFNKWFASPFAPSLPSAPDAQRMINPTDNNGEILPADQKTMNNREKEWGQDSEEQLKADAQLWRAIDENMAGDARAAIDGEKELMKAETKNLPDDTKLPEQPKQTLREKWFKARVQNARERAAEMARKYVAENPDHARELAFADPETMTEYDAPVDQGMLIRAVMETVPQGSEEWYLLDNNLAMVKSMSGSTLALSGDQSHQAYLDAKREIEAARELKAATNYAGTSQGAMEKWNADIRAFIAARTAAIVATEPESAERQAAIKAMLEEAKTKFSANTTNAILNQLDLTGMRTKDSQVFIKWAEKQIKQAAHARIDTKEQQELMKASIAAQLALKDIDSTEVKDGKYVRAMQSGKDIRHWQFVKDKMKKAYIGRWGKFGIFMDNLFGSYAPSAMLMSVNTLFFANVPSTAVNTATTRIAAHAIGKNLVDSNIQSEEIKRIKQVFNASGVNLAQMDKPTSPSMLHGEKYTNQEQKHWYNFTFDVLGREDNVFRVPTFVDALARIATKNANGDKAKANALFKEYCQLNTTSEEAKIARKQALAVANMAVFTQDGIMASALNHIRSSLNTMSRGLLGLQPNGFGLGNILAPFLKTGANITEMGLSATLAPVRLVMTAMQKLQGKEIPDVKKIALLSDWINLAWMSVVIAVIAAINSDDDEWYIEPYQPGQAYDPDKPYDSVNFGGVWVKVDIFGPLAIPLRAAMKAVNGWEKRKMAAVADGLFFGGMEALSDTPLVNQVTDSSLDYMVKKPGAYWQGFGYNQLNKLVPSQLKSISRATTRGANVEYSGEWMGKTIGKKFHRNYGLDGQRLTTNDLINILTNRLKIQE